MRHRSRKGPRLRSHQLTTEGLRGFNRTQETVQTTDTTFDVFTKSFPVGEVTLGGNSGLGGSGARSMYSVVIVPEALPCRVDLSPVTTGTVTLTATGPSGATYRWRVSGQVLTGANPQVHLPAGRHPVFVTVTRGPLSKTCGGVKIAHHPLVSTPARTATKLVWAGPDTLNVNPDNGTVTRVSGADRTVLWEREGGPRPVSLTMAGDEVWVVDQDEAAVKVLSAISGALTRTIALPRGSAPHAIVRSGDDTTYVTLTATGEVVAIDAAGTIVEKKRVAPTARGLTWFDDRLYVTRFISPDERGEVYMVDPTTLQTTGVVNLAFDPGPDTEATGRGVPNYVAEVTISPDGRRAFVASKKDNIARGLWRDGEALTFESRVRAIVSVFDPATGQEDLDARRDINDREMVHPR